VAAPKKYSDELRERATRMALDARRPAQGGADMPLQSGAQAGQVEVSCRIRPCRRQTPGGVGVVGRAPPLADQAAWLLR